MVHLHLTTMLTMQLSRNIQIEVIVSKTIICGKIQRISFAQILLSVLLQQHQSLFMLFFLVKPAKSKWSFVVQNRSVPPEILFCYVCLNSKPNRLGVKWNQKCVIRRRKKRVKYRRRGELSETGAPTIMNNVREASEALGRNKALAVVIERSGGRQGI